MNEKLTILTATYNRAHLIGRCYESLKSQTNNAFKWLIIDDGSSDNTEQVVKDIIKEEASFKIEYHKKINGGKHTALNFSHQFINTEYVMFLDDDDILYENAVEIILNYWKQYEENEKIGCICFQKGGFFDRKPLVDWEIGEDIISNTIEFRINARRNGDCAEVIRKKMFVEYPAPEFDGERFLSEDFLWINSAYKYDTVYVRQVIYLCAYLEDGLTTSGHWMKIKNPRGGMYTANLYLKPEFSLYVKIKKAILYDSYLFATKEICRGLREANNIFLCICVLPVGLFFFMKWSKIRR